MRLLITALGACLIFTVSLRAEPAQTIPGAAGPDEEVLRIYQSIVVTTTALEPRAETHSDEVYKRTLFSRDDQLVETLNAGINAGQHEGGGKSLEVRRFGFNLDHGGANGGLKILIDNIQQNQGTQGHGQGYLGSLKSLIPELVNDVHILNGPFSAEYGDFSGLGVVHIRLKENLEDQGTIRIQRGRFGSHRTFLSYSPVIDKADAFLAYERSRTDGPFLNPLRYKRDNLTANYTRRLQGNQAAGIKFNFGGNDFSSPGQIPLDLVATGEYPRFGSVDPSNGGRVRAGTLGMYYRKAIGAGSSFKADGFVSRSMFDLYSNFTMFLNNEERGDEIQQHDSRLQEGFNAQFLHSHRIFGRPALLVAGSNFHDNQIRVGLNPSQRRVPLGVDTSALARVTNTAGYVQQGMDILGGRLHLEGGVRWDYFRFKVCDNVNTEASGAQGEARLQPKFGIAFTPTRAAPVTMTFNYGRGINTQDARGVVQRPDSPRIATTDFYQLGAAVQHGPFSVSGDVFLIDRSNEQVYIPDDGTFELKDPTRSYGYEGKASMQLTRYLSLNAGLTQVTNSFYRNTAPRIYVDSAPHRVANAAITFSRGRGLFGSLRYRHAGSYRLDGLDPSIRASGLDVVDLSVMKSINRWIDVSLSVDNVTNKSYYETQNLFESRVAPGAAAVERIHGTPGYPIGFTAGVTLHFFPRD